MLRAEDRRRVALAEAEEARRGADDARKTVEEQERRRGSTPLPLRTACARARPSMRARREAERASAALWRP